MLQWSVVIFFRSRMPPGAGKGTRALSPRRLCCSYLPEAGQYQCIMLYLQNQIGFSKPELAAYIAFVGILSIVAQTYESPQSAPAGLPTTPH